MSRYYLLSAILAFTSAKPINIPMELHSITPHGRIVGGEATDIEKVPYQVSLQIYGFSYCGGSIISESWILTAGHCAGYPSQYITIRSGSSQFNSGGKINEVKDVIRHEEYQTNMYGVPINDVALLHLEKPLQLDATRQPIPLFEKDEEATAGSISTITGWGALKQGGNTAEILQTVNIPIVSKEECNSAYSSFGGIPGGQICAAHPEGGRDACQGDSGGPLTIEGKLAGIVSWGNGCAIQGYPGVYTEVAAFKDWIMERIRI